MNNNITSKKLIGKDVEAVIAIAIGICLEGVRKTWDTQKMKQKF
jgi:hypothetical protein